MDGTLVDSTAGVVGAWNNLRKTYPHLDVQNILNTSHGVRTIENLRQHLGIDDPEILEREAELFEKDIVCSASENGGPGIVILPGVKPIIDLLSPYRFLPKPCWAICTSGTRAYASSALVNAAIPLPDVFITSEDVTKGKPHPDPYLLGAEKCGLSPKNCIVFEDAPNGIRSGKAAGCTTVALLTTHSRDLIEAAQPDFIVKDLSQISIECSNTGIQVVINLVGGNHQDCTA